ncbi:apolipo protein O-domain-containing protein [Boeremia exigua]|uniref:apolipo protein O-domain-containing protein n=1 Tax=Boeremia exigua TaxID=749465 RepID=UPI001E8DBA2F|nr:apolipo protein O-domain-containing protein [Boeremia exigua]KAH6637565.1 apolipo protein O-domain-containing protein [Boeremia exigua]
MAAALAAAAVFTPRTLHAEEQPSAIDRKPIYDDLPIDTTAPTAPALTQPAQALTPEAAYRPTPTDRLAQQIGGARLALYRQAVRGEAAVDRALTETLRLEHSFTSTVRSLAPPRESGERIFPGALYVLVAAMAGSIVTRNRNVLLRASVPAAVGITAAYAVLPITMSNVGGLVWSYEEKYPALAEAHLRTKANITHFIETGKAHAGMTVGRVQEKVHDVRDSMEGWVKKGR